MKKVIFVCLGNICRSPMAHGIFRDKVQKLGIDVLVESAGTSSFHIGEHADKRAISTLRAKGIDITDLRSRLFIETDLDDFDYIFTMDEHNQKEVFEIVKRTKHSNHPKMLMNLVYPKQNISIPDPYYGGVSGFETVYQMLDLALEKLLEKIKAKQK